MHVLSHNLATTGNYCAANTESLAELPSKFRDVAPSDAVLVSLEHGGSKLFAATPASLGEPAMDGVNRFETAALPVVRRTGRARQYGSTVAINAYPTPRSVLII